MRTFETPRTRSPARDHATARLQRARDFRSRIRAPGSGSGRAKVGRARAIGRGFVSPVLRGFAAARVGVARAQLARATRRDWAADLDAAKSLENWRHVDREARLAGKAAARQHSQDYRGFVADMFQSGIPSVVAAPLTVALSPVHVPVHLLVTRPSARRRAEREYRAKALAARAGTDGSEAGVASTPAPKRHLYVVK